MTDQRSEVARRRVFYIPGYDPFHPRRYRELYRREAAAQADISGYEIALKAVPSDGTGHGWRVAARIDGARVEAGISVLVWSDIVRDSMAQSIPATYWQMLRTLWIYLSTGALRRLMWLRKGPVIAALYPPAMLLAQLALAAGAFRAVSVLLTGLLENGAEALWIGGVPVAAGVVAQALGAGAGVVSFVAVLRWFKAQDGRFFAHYLMHDYAHAARLRGAYPPELEARLAEFEDRIAAALVEEVDEVLVVGHSSGAHLAVSVLADLLRAGRVPRNGPALALLSLGQVVPMLSFLPRAHRLRADLRLLADSDALTWVDVSAPSDGGTFALCDPVAVSGVAPERKRWPLVFSAQYTRALSPERMSKLRWRFFRLHFQYLCAFDRPRDYDYFRITAGPLTLGTRYAGRPPSASRIDVPVSKYTSVAA